jgi:hypothetical protein
MALTKAGKYREAMEQVNAASAAAKTATERQKVDQAKQYVAITSGDASIGGALGAKAKMAGDINAGRWKEVIADADGLKKTNSLDATYSLQVAQAFFMLHDSKGCMNYIRSNGLGGESALALLQRCAYDAGDEATQRQALEQLVSSTQKPEHWKSLLKLSERAKGISDHGTLDIFRLKAMTGTLNEGPEIFLYAQFALQLKMSAEAKAVLAKGVADKLLTTDERTNRLIKLANDRANENAAGFGRAMADAQKQPKGDALVALGEDQIGQGKAKDAVDTIKAGIAKGCNDTANCQLRLGTAYLAAGQKAEAVKALGEVKGDDKIVMVAHLYSLAARSGGASSSADEASAKAPAKKRGKR